MLFPYKDGDDWVVDYQFWGFRLRGDAMLNCILRVHKNFLHRIPFPPGVNRD